MVSQSLLSVICSSLLCFLWFIYWSVSMRVCHTVQSVQGDFICRVMLVQLNQNILPGLGCVYKILAKSTGCLLGESVWVMCQSVITMLTMCSDTVCPLVTLVIITMVSCVSSGTMSTLNSFHEEHNMTTCPFISSNQDWSPTDTDRYIKNNSELIIKD